MTIFFSDKNVLPWQHHLSTYLENCSTYLNQILADLYHLSKATFCQRINKVPTFHSFHVIMDQCLMVTVSWSLCCLSSIMITSLEDEGARCCATLPLDTRGGLQSLIVALPGDRSLVTRKPTKWHVRPSKTQIAQSDQSLH